MDGKLFTQNFLAEGIKETYAWKHIEADAFERFKQEAGALFQWLHHGNTPNEATTETEIIFPLLSALGWQDNLTQQNLSAKGRSDVPDGLLFSSTEAKTRALTESQDANKFAHGLAVLESKRWELHLDRRSSKDNKTPSSQLLLYLRRAAAMSSGAIIWGILTNGRHWRLYYEKARSIAEDFVEFDIPALLGLPGMAFDLLDQSKDNAEHYLKAFYLIFSRDSFMPQAYDAAGRTFHEIALDDARHWEIKVSNDLGKIVFDIVFPQLIAAIAENDPNKPNPITDDYLEALRRAALSLLYRLLFVFYAEDRNLLPVHDTRYDDYSLRKIREDIARRIDALDVFSASASRYYSHLADLFEAIAIGDASIGLPPYNGGLFDSARHPILKNARLSDAVMAPIIDKLSRHYSSSNNPKWINYRDLTVQQLGSIYERLLEYTVVVGDDGQLAIRPNIFARKGSGSYYTHDDLVKLVLQETVGPLVLERVEAFNTTAKELTGQKQPKKKRLETLYKLDPAENIIRLKICDPAMGSGHFLVSLVDYLADSVLEHMASASAMVEFDDYVSPLANRIEEIRTKILQKAKQESWIVDESQLDDRHIVRRFILKRVIFGVDKNEMAVELAKVALWLHTFTVGAPLSFLDHHLRWGDSLYGEWTRVLNEEVWQGEGLLSSSGRTKIKIATATMEQLTDLTDSDIAEVRASKELFNAIMKEIEPLRCLMDFWHSVRWLKAMTPAKADKKAIDATAQDIISARYGDPVKVVQKGSIPGKKKDRERQAANDLLQHTRTLAEEERFLHWELAFPMVWDKEVLTNVRGGFDAVIGNPPWDLMKLQQVEWFADRKPEIAMQAKAAARKKMVAAIQKKQTPLWHDYQRAQGRSEAAMKIVRNAKEYPLLGKGDLNLYSLFVERATRLVKPEGIIGLVTPSGIASDKNAAEFFSGIATAGRLAKFYDFENKKIFFPDIHASFKFCAMVFGGRKRLFPNAECAYFLHNTNELTDPKHKIEMGPKDFAIVNPNTGTAPIFRTARDARITLDIYRRLPVLVDRSKGKVTKLWPIKYKRMFDMSNDSHLFKTKLELNEEGWYPVGGNRWKRGGEECVPLYEGKMVQLYDHRAANIVINEDNLHRPAIPEAASCEQHKKTDWLPNPQYWISTRHKNDIRISKWVIGFKDVTAPTNQRSMIASLLPFYGFGNTLPVFIPDESDCTGINYKFIAPIILANMNSFIWDYIARQKIQGQHLNLYIIEQVPFVSKELLTHHGIKADIPKFIFDQVLHLSYTAKDMEPFARDMGYEGEPFEWDEEDRRHRMARLDALFFHLYGINRDDAAYILDTFPIVRKHDKAEFGHYRTKDMVLAYMNAVKAGDMETILDV